MYNNKVTPGSSLNHSGSISQSAKALHERDKKNEISLNLPVREYRMNSTFMALGNTAFKSRHNASANNSIEKSIKRYIEESNNISNNNMEEYLQTIQSFEG